MKPGRQLQLADVCALAVNPPMQSAARVAATVLTRAAVDRGSRDNVTVRVTGCVMGQRIGQQLRQQDAWREQHLSASQHASCAIDHAAAHGLCAGLRWQPLCRW